MERSVKILLVEDDPNLGNLLAEYLRAKGHEVTLRNDGQKGWMAYKDSTYDLLVLDVMMPVKDGFSLARDIRKEDKQTPIIFLTAKSMKQDTIEGFKAGADDYLTKPFSMEELLLRVKAVMRRSKGLVEEEETPDEYAIGGFVFDPRKQLLALEGKERKLTTKENELLLLLCRNANTILERSDALREIWGEDSYFNGRSMDVYIAKLRKYLRPDPKVEILNVHGRGFRLITDQEEQ